jgi:hypothetical protein
MQNSIQQGGFAAERKETRAMIERNSVLQNASKCNSAALLDYMQ